jgi:lipopolysaccharide transport system permease protein
VPPANTLYHTGGPEASLPWRLLQPASPAWYTHANPIALVRNLWRQRVLIRQFAWRELRGRYQGSCLGVLWSLLTPVLLLLVYTFVFSKVLKARWGISPDETALEFALTLFVGLVLYNVFAESLSRAPNLILGQPNLVKKVVFPTEILPLATLFGALGHALLSLVVVCAAHACFVGAPGWNILWFPLVLAPFCCFVLGLCWFLSALGVFVRDLGPTLAIVLQLLMFLTPIFYPLHIVPETWRGLFRLNPLAVFVENARRTLLWDQPPIPTSMVVTAIGSCAVLLLGYIWFVRTKRAFADVV